MPFEKFCDLWFSHKSRLSDFCFGRPLHVLCMGWEVKIDMSGQSNEFFTGAETGHISENIRVLGL